MSNTSNSNTNNNLYNICSLEHCYTNLFALTDITGIKWLKLRVKEKLKNGANSTSNSNTNSSNKSKLNQKEKKRTNRLNGNVNDQDDINEDEDEQEDDEDEDDNDDDEQEENQDSENTNKKDENQSTPSKLNTTNTTIKNNNKNSPKTTKSNFINTTYINDPILITHSKCLNEDILCAWKRVEHLTQQQQQQQQNKKSSDTQNEHESSFHELIPDDDQFKKELWIFWYEKEEPPNLRSLISSDLVVDQSQSNQANQNHQNTSQNFSQSQDENILSMASSSLNALPYEARSMLFKALHNLIEKSLLEKGYARLGKWFVMPYNLNSINYSIYNQKSDNISNSSILLNNNNSNNPTSNPNQTQSTNQQQSTQAPSNPVQPSRSGSKLNNFNNSSSSNLAQTSSILNNHLNQIDESNHVSYSFSFFLHGASRVCTSVDIKLHKPIRYLNQFDLNQLKENLKNYLLQHHHNSSNESNSRKRKSEKFKTKIKFSSQNVILAPYGIKAKLLGYLSNESVESKLTCEEWKQFYPLKLIPNFPNVFVVGLNRNRVKLFYPNCFIYIVMDSDSDRSDDDELNHVNLTDSELNSSLEESLTSLNSSNNTSQTSSGEDDDLDDDLNQHISKLDQKDLINSSKSGKNKEMDSLDLTIDSVARNFGTTNNTINEKQEENTNKSYLSISLTSPLSVTAISSPSSAQSPSQNTLNIQSPQTAGSIQSSRRASIVNNSSLNPANSPGKQQQLKRSKSNNLNRSSSIVEPLAPPSVASVKSVKKRKKNFDSSSSDLSLNSSINTSNLNESTSAKKVDLDLSSLRKKVRLNVLNNSNDKKLTDNSNMNPNNSITNRKLNKLVNINKNSRNLLAKNRVSKSANNYLKKLNLNKYKFLTVDNVLSNFLNTNSKQTRTILSKSSNHLRPMLNVSSRNDICCKYKFNLNKNLTNQIRLKHKKYDLLTENLPLAFDILDKSNFSSCTNYICTTSSSQMFNCTRCSSLSINSTNTDANLKYQKCSCNTANNQPSNVSPSTIKISPKQLTKKELGSSLNATTNSLTNLIKTEPDLNKSSTLNQTSKTQFKPFHKRRCYFNHKKPINFSFKAYKAYLNKFKTTTNRTLLKRTLHTQSKANQGSNKIKIIKVKSTDQDYDNSDLDYDTDSSNLSNGSLSNDNEYEDDYDEDENDEDLDEEVIDTNNNETDDLFTPNLDDNSNSSLASSVKTDTDMFNYQYFEKEDDDSLFSSDNNKNRKKTNLISDSSDDSSNRDSSDSTISSSSLSSSSSSDDEDMDEKFRSTFLNRPCLTNLTNKAFEKQQLLNTQQQTTINEFKFKKLNDYQQSVQNTENENNDLDVIQNSDNDEKSFDNFYDLNQSVIVNNNMNNFNNNVDCTYISQEYTDDLSSACLIPKSSQMTPPKSVESFQTPLSNNSIFTNNQASTSHHPHSHHSNAANVPPISYDDLNNIFDEESSTDEQQNNGLNIQPQSNQQITLQQPSTSSQPVITTIQTSLSVVMTPPSHENVIKPNQTNLSNLALNEDDLLNLNFLNDQEASNSFNVNNNNRAKFTLTKTILFNDLNSILSDTKRKSLFLTNSQVNKFEIPKLTNNININKYKPIKFNQEQIGNEPSKKNKLKWKLSSNSIKKSKNLLAKQEPNQTEDKQKPNPQLDLMLATGTCSKLTKLNLELTKLEPKIKPLDQFFNQIDQLKFKKLNLNLTKFLNSVCLSLNLSDTLLNSYRDINFDSCTLCVCTNNNIKGIDFSTYICNDIFNTNESNLSINNNLFNPSNSSHNQYTNCTCGFSSIVNRGLLTNTSKVVRLKHLIKIIDKLKLEAQEQNLLVPYYNLIQLLNRLTEPEYQTKQMIVLDSNNFNGLFLEDYIDVLMLTEPHYLFHNILQENSKFILNSNVITRKFLNSILIRENYLWKKSFSFLSNNNNNNNNQKRIDQTPEQKNKSLKNLNQTDEKLIKKQNNEFELVKLTPMNEFNVLDLFDQKYSSPLLTTNESYELFYLNGQQFDLNENLDVYNLFESSCTNTKLTSKLKRYLNQNLNLINLNRYDENKICTNILKRLDRFESDQADLVSNLDESKFLLHNWLYSKREIKSNLELTKSLKLIQPLLEETVQKKYTTSRMWESFQGPLTWQHFCRLAFRDSGNTQQNRQHNSHSSSSAPSGSSAQSQSNQANQQNNHSCYEPEPIPALVVSSSDKDWITISPYAVKFWDKLNLEPYSKQKNIAYLIIMPDFNTENDKDSVNELNEYENTKQSVKDYFKELNSIYELCRLGLHRPALRIAPEQGFVRVQLTSSNKSKSNVKVDEWFTKIQQNKHTRQLGKHLKSYAKCFRQLAAKLSHGHTSTIANTVEASFFPNENLNNNVRNPTSFASTTPTIPIVSNINLDRSIYEEMKQPKQEIQNQPVNANQITSATVSSTPSLSSILNTQIGPDLLLNQNDFNHHHSPLDFGSTSTGQASQQLQAQILNFGNNSDIEVKETVFVDTATQQYQQQQQTLNNIASGSNLTQISQLTANLTSPPSLFVYIIDPFDFHLYNTFKNEASSKANKKPADQPMEGIKKEDCSDIDDDNENDLDDDQTESEKINEFDLRRLRTLGLFKAYLEFYNNIPDLFKYSTQFQIVPLNLCVDIQQQSTSIYMQSMMMHKKLNSSNYSSFYSSGFGTGWSDLDMDFKLSLLKTQAFNTFTLSKRYFMSPAHNFYLNLHQQQINTTRPKIFTSFGPAASEEKFLRSTLLNSNPACTNSKKTFSDMRKLQFYSPLFVLAPSTITTSAVSLAASNLFFKNSDFQSQKSNQNSHNTNGAGECISQMPHFIQLNMSNSNYGFLNSNNNYNFNLNDVIHQQQQLLNGSSSLLNNSTGIGSVNGLGNSSTGSGSTSQLGQSSSNQSSTNNACLNSNFLLSQPHQQQCNVLYVGYCLSEDQRYLLTSCCDENGELVESTSIYIEVDERFRRKENHTRRIALRKLWEFIIVVISQTCKPWRLVIGRLGRMGHSELRGWGCLLSKKNLQRVCQQLKENCEACNTLGVLEAPCILSACLISMEKCDTICVYPESYSREDKFAAAALIGQQTQLSNHAAQAHGVSCTHILTFPASAIIQTQSASMVGSNMKDLDPLSKSALGAMPMEDDIFGFFNFEEEEMTDLLNDNMNDKNLNESGTANEADQVSMKEKIESMLNQEDLAHLDQQPLAVGYYVSTAKCGPLPKWLRGDVSLDTNFHTFKATLHIHNRYALENDELIMKTENSHKLDSSVTYEVLRYVLERYNALSWLNIDPLMQDRKSCLPIHHSILLQMYYAFKNYI